MRWPRARGALAAGALLGLLAVAVAPARADLPPLGPMDVAIETYVDHGVFEESTPWRYEIRAGDTLTGIAERQLGSTRRWREIQALNRGLDANRLQPGTKLLLPAAKPPAPGAKVPYTWLLWLPVEGGGALLRPVARGEPIVASSGVHVVALRPDLLDEVERALREAPAAGPALEKLAADGRIALGGPLSGSRRVYVSSGVPRVFARYRVASSEGGRLRLEEVPMEAPQAGAGDAESAPPAWALLLVLLGTLVAAALALRGGTRRAEPA